MTCWQLSNNYEVIKMTQPGSLQSCTVRGQNTVVINYNMGYPSFPVRKITPPRQSSIRAGIQSFSLKNFKIQLDKALSSLV